MLPDDGLGDERSPAAQSSHVVCPILACACPDLHATQGPTGFGPYLPMGQPGQDDSAPVTVLYVPRVQVLHVNVVGSRYLPIPQATQLCADVEGIFPAAQTEHSVAPNLEREREEEEKRGQRAEAKEEDGKKKKKKKKKKVSGPEKKK